jgi:hypothetical protein
MAHPPGSYPARTRSTACPTRSPDSQAKESGATSTTLAPASSSPNPSSTAPVKATDKANSEESSTHDRNRQPGRGSDPQRLNRAVGVGESLPARAGLTACIGDMASRSVACRSPSHLLKRVSCVARSPQSSLSCYS